jgi:hypothetical protein
MKFKKSFLMAAAPGQGLNQFGAKWYVVARALGAIALFVTGGVHYEQYTVAHFSVIPTIGPLFLANFIAATILGLILLVPIRGTSGRGRLILDASAAVAGTGVAAGALAALLISEQTPLFGFMEHGYRLEIIIAIAAEAVAITALAVVLACIGRRVRGVRVAAVRLGSNVADLPDAPNYPTQQARYQQ